MTPSHGPIRGPNLVVVGFRAAGAIEAALATAERLGFTFVDTAERIAEGTGFSPAEIAESFGEHRLRTFEAGMARELAGVRDAVIVPARGMLEDAEGRRLLRRAGWIFYVRPGREDLVRRYLRRAARIPTGGWVFDVAAEAAALFDRLDPMLRAASDVVLDAGARRPETLAGRIAARFEGVRSA
ncbi:MAG: hypothetical protein JXP34_07820 [Planctomycetes bacterium]|nr:hypothetical protein [Planctomycetota bacterium]